MNLYRIYKDVFGASIYMKVGPVWKNIENYGEDGSVIEYRAPDVDYLADTQMWEKSGGRDISNRIAVEFTGTEEQLNEQLFLLWL